ncbi:MAG: group 1 truncated hemoglobin [Methyloversatilis sp. 12-65-5]|nr:MAG: group 1 truncated hemoglobin [Methyloversatilis sp. 12-65-5]
MKNLRLLLSTSCLALLSGCAHIEPDVTLYQRLGGEPGIERIVSDFVDRFTTDPRTRDALDGIRVTHLKQSITQFICLVADGPNGYEGLDMKKTHEDAPVTEVQFDSVVEMMRDALDKHVSTAEKNELLRRLAPMKRDIVAHYRD